MAAESITDSLSPSTIVGPLIGTPRYRSVRCKSMTCSVHVLAATCSEPNVAVSTVDCVDPGFPFRLTPMSFALRVTNSP